VITSKQGTGDGILVKVDKSRNLDLLNGDSHRSIAFTDHRLEESTFKKIGEESKETGSKLEFKKSDINSPLIEQRSRNGNSKLIMPNTTQNAAIGTKTFAFEFSQKTEE
jgi:hypothetical protein